MKRISKFALGAMALGLMACASDAPMAEDSSVDMTGKTAYMKINISCTADATRATTDEGYQYGEADEHTVNDAQFFFYDKDGLFVTKATVWTGGEAVSNPNENHDQNVEYMGNNVIVLKNLTNTPVRYLLTVLNLPDFQPSSTIEETAQKLYNYQNTIQGKNYHVMTTSSYFGESDNHRNDYPYATYINSDDYMVQPSDISFSADDLDKVVNIYVERLAAKVEVKLASNFSSDEETGPVKRPDGTVLYPIRATVSGYNNGTLDNTDDIGAEMLYVKFTGWGLNAVLPQSSLFKQIDYGWLRTPPFDNWNDPDHYRSYWTKTPYYGFDPTKWLSYLSFNQISSRIGDNVYKSEVNYCNGNTNTLEAIFQGENLVPSKVTHALIGAVICDSEGNALDLVRATSGEMYTKQSYINYIFSLAKPEAFYDAGDGQTKIQITPNDLELDWDKDNNGVIRIAIKGVKDNKTLYNTSGEPIPNPVDYLSGFFNSTQQSLQPEAYKGGAMYYAIPIEHMGALNAAADVKPYTTLGYYGVVRNFWYVITLESLSRFGHGVFDPEATIIPDSPDDQNYLLGAKINILSWKVLNQSVNM